MWRGVVQRTAVWCGVVRLGPCAAVKRATADAHPGLHDVALVFALTWPRKLSVRCSADARAVVVVGTESEGSTTSVRPEGMACETATTLPSKSRATIESAFMSSADVIDVLIDSSDAPSNQPTVASFPYPRTTTVLRAAIWQRANTGRAGQRPVEQRCAS